MLVKLYKQFSRKSNCFIVDGWIVNNSTESIISIEDAKKNFGEEHTDLNRYLLQSFIPFYESPHILYDNKPLTFSSIFSRKIMNLLKLKIT